MPCVARAVFDEGADVVGFGVAAVFEVARAFEAIAEAGELDHAAEDAAPGGEALARGSGSLRAAGGIPMADDGPEGGEDVAAVGGVGEPHVVDFAGRVDFGVAVLAVVGDMTGDGRPDIALTTRSMDVVYIYRNVNGRKPSTPPG